MELMMVVSMFSTQYSAVKFTFKYCFDGENADDMIPVHVSVLSLSVVLHVTASLCIKARIKGQWVSGGTTFSH